MDKNCDICRFIAKPLYPIMSRKYWDVELAQNQAYLGRTYIRLLEHKSNLREVSEDEWLDLKLLIQKLESAYRKALDATSFNWACLMNDSYQEKPYNPHVHWHLLPRYEKPIQFEELTFKDQQFGHMFMPYKKLIIDDQKLKKITEKIQSYLVD